MNLENYSSNMKKDRISKDQFFKDNFQSPIPSEERDSFVALEYFEPNISYRFELFLEEFEVKEHVQLEDSGGNMRDLLKWGKFGFQVAGEKCVLYAYKSDEADVRLFVPFKDATSGKETYGAGRYMDLVEAECKVGDKWIVDFNLVTNPWCAYSHNYVCPLIPFENILKIKIEAGEKSFK